MDPVNRQGVFVGRKRELAILTAALSDAEAGHGRVVVLAGDAGIGKTRLTTELAAIADARSWLVLRGACLEVTASEPYRIWAQMLATAAQESVPNSTRPSIEEMLALIGGTAFGDGLPGVEIPLQAMAASGSAAASRTRWLIASCLSGLADKRPVVAILDDLHWADQPSIAALEYVAHVIGASRALILGAYRSADLPRRHPLRDALGAMARLPLYTRIALAGLTRSDTERLMTSYIRSGMHPGLADEVHSVTEGNPFFIREISREAADSRSEQARHYQTRRHPAPKAAFRTPETVREVIELRFRRISLECRRLLEFAAVIGRDFSLAEVEPLRASATATSARPEASLGTTLSLLDEATEAQLIVQLPGDMFRYRFAHELIRRALEEALPAGRRAGLHAIVATLLEGSGGDAVAERAAEIAGHLLRAGSPDPGKLSHLAEIAGQLARRADDAEAASEWFGVALRSGEVELALIEAAGPDDHTPVQLRRRLALLRAQLAVTRYVRATGHQDGQARWDEMAASFRELVGIGATSEALELASTTFGVGRLKGLLPVTGQALSLATPDTVRYADLLCRHSVALWVEAGDIATPERLLAAAVGIAREQRVADLEYRALRHLGQLGSVRWDHRFAAKYGAQAWRIFVRQTAWPRGRPNLHAILIPSLAATGQFERAQEVVASLSEMAERFLQDGIPAHVTYSPFEAMVEARYWGALLGRVRGEWDRLEAFISSDGSEGPFWDRASLVIRALMSADRSQPANGSTKISAGFQEALALARPQLGDVPGLGQNVLLLPAFAAAAFDLTDELLMAEVTARAREVLAWEPKLPQYAVQARLSLAFAAAMDRDRTQAAALYRDLLPWAAAFDIHGGFSYERLLGLLARIRGNVKDAEAHFSSAIERCERAGFKTEIPRVHRDHAEMLLETGADRARTLAVIAAGIGVAQELGMSRLASRFNYLEAPAGMAPRYPAGLSEREVEVLRHMAMGRTNQQIADALSISRFTVIRHATNIYAKIGATNRTDAASYAHRHGLTG